MIAHNPTLSPSTAEAFAGILLGTAVGDALGLPAENLSPQRIQRFWSGTWQMRFLGKRGMTSDDTDHTLMVAQALLTEPTDAWRFQRSLAWKLRWWFASLPAGVGLATARACCKLWLEFPPDASSVTSAGSGPAMRCAILGAFFSHDPNQRRQFVSASTSITHRGWQAEVAAHAIAECVALTVSKHHQPERQEILHILRALSRESEWLRVLAEIEHALKQDLSVVKLAQALGLERGVSGYALHVAPVALYAWMRHPGDFREALIQALNCGGDTDTVGAIVGALSGATVGEAGIPEEWKRGICEWPRSIFMMSQVANRLVDQKAAPAPLGPVNYVWPGVIPRNLLFLVVVLLHGFRRLVPPY